MKNSTRKGLAITAGTITGISLCGLALFVQAKLCDFIGGKIVDASFAVGEAILKSEKPNKTVED